MAVAEEHQAKTAAEPDPAPEAAPTPPRPGRGRRAARHAVRHGVRFFILWFIAIFGFVVCFTVLAALALLNRPVALPGWVTHRIEAQMNRGFDRGQISLGRIDLMMERGSAPRIRLVNVGLSDASGAEVARLNDVGAGFELSKLIRGDVMPETLRLSGAQVTIRRRTDGSFDLSFGEVAQTSGSLAEVLDRIDALFSSGPLSRVSRIEARELTLTLEDARSVRLWQVTDGRMDFTQDDEAIDIGVNFDVFNGTEDLATTQFTFHSDKGSPAAEIGVSFSNAASGDIALQSPVLAFLGVLDAPISGALRLAFGSDGRLGSFAGTLEIGQGALTPGGDAARQVQIDRGKAYFTYDPRAKRIDFSDLEVESDAGAVRLSGQTFLEDLRPDGWPGALVGQFTEVNLRAEGEGLLPRPVEFRDGAVELKLRLDPFDLTVGKLRLTEGDTTLRLSGRARITPDGPELAVDAEVDRIGRDELLSLWPETLIPKPRKWLVDNLDAGTFTDGRAAVRIAPGAAPRTMLGWTFHDARIRFMPSMPLLTGGSGYGAIVDDRMTVRADAGQVEAPDGGTVDIAGTVMVIPDIKVIPAPAEIALAAKGPIPAMLSLLDQKPFLVMQKAGKPIDIVTGAAEATAQIRLPLKAGLQPDEVDFSVAGTLTGLSSDKLVEGRLLAADEMALSADPKEVRVSGPARFGRLPVEATWTQGIGPGAKPGHVDARVTIGPAFLDEFGIALPDGAVKGGAAADVAIDLGGPAPGFRLTSGLSGAALRLTSIAWSKAANAKGRLEVAGVLGARPRIDRLVLEGGGLSATGQVTLKSDNSLDEARFDRVKLGGWLDAPVTLQGRGRDAQPGVVVRGGTLDFRKAAFGDGAGGSAGGPVRVALDRLYVADSITLTGFKGDFSTRGGFHGDFVAQLNGGGTINGTVAPQNGGTALRVTSENAGDVLRDANVAQRVRGGAMQLVLLPTGQKGVYSGSLTAGHVRVRGTPALAELINAVSIVGLLQQLNGDGIVFDQVEAAFLLTPNAINFTQASGVGASLGISAQGSYTLGSGALDIQGTFSPIYLVNGIGQIFSKKGEGLFGFNYRVRGTSEDPKVSVNPLSILTPGAFREIFRAPPPKIR